MAGRLSSTEEAVLEVCRKHGNAGVADALLQEELHHMTMQARMMAINSLLNKHRLTLLTNPADESLVYKEVIAEDAAKFKGLGTEEMLVYQHIQASGNYGIWTKDLKMKTNLAQPQITKLLKVLEQRSLIKAIKSVSNANRKVYMLYELEPARELTGGAWYTEHEYDSEFIEVLQQACYQFILNAGEASLDDVALFIKEKGFSKVELRADDVMSLINCLEYDGKIDRVEREEGEMFRRALLEIPDTSAFTNVPCGSCPVFNDCTPDGAISPNTCVYYQKWLDF
ncbi:hypothetical protein WJX72_012527 [[Myrmecia] bisecta]|uniref:DNA-directed RNA polymerase III subunit RPC6 n=1 Tax=[Myrmecia] bisecta TaxID=41462 RepID=A0AAW1Q5K6_9CHLO